MKTCLALALLAGCSGAATARLELVNQALADTAPGEAVLPDGTSLRIKLIAVYLAEDVDPVTQNNVGQTAMIWLNPECEDDIGGCNVDGMQLPEGGPRVTRYFDFSRSTADVNAELNSQPAEVTAGTYRYARIELCKGLGGQTEATVPTLLWRAPGMDGERALTSGDCARTSLPFEPPLALGAGDAVEVALGYDLDRAIVVGAPDPQRGSFSLSGDQRYFRACSDAGPGLRACMDFPDFVPSARRAP